MVDMKYYDILSSNLNFFLFEADTNVQISLLETYSAFNENRVAL
jgi:hypothetical protein